MTTTTDSTKPLSRRERQRVETRRDLAMAALELAAAHGLAGVRVPDIAAAAGVSTRTFNNYFSSKEAAIAWPMTRRAGDLAEHLLARPDGEPPSVALLKAVSDTYRDRRQDGPRAEWLQRFRTLVAQEPALRGEYLKAADAGERALAAAIATRTEASGDDLRPMVLAAVVTGAERAAVRWWMQSAARQTTPLRETVGEAVRQALQEVQP